MPCRPQLPLQPRRRPLQPQVRLPQRLDLPGAVGQVRVALGDDVPEAGGFGVANCIMADDAVGRARRDERQRRFGRRFVFYKNMDIKSFKGALAQIAEERGISPEKVIETIESAIATAYKKDY